MLTLKPKDHSLPEGYEELLALEGSTKSKLTKDEDLDSGCDVDSRSIYIVRPRVIVFRQYLFYESLNTVLDSRIG